MAQRTAMMTKGELRAVADRGVPFTLLMADGREYFVPHRDYIYVPPRGMSVIVYKDDGGFNFLPLLTMTGIRSTDPETADPSTAG